MTIFFLDKIISYAYNWSLISLTLLFLKKKWNVRKAKFPLIIYYSTYFVQKPSTEPILMKFINKSENKLLIHFIMWDLHHYTILGAQKSTSRRRLFGCRGSIWHRRHGWLSESQHGLWFRRLWIWWYYNNYIY